MPGASISKSPKNDRISSCERQITGLVERSLPEYRPTPPPDPALVAVAMAHTEERWARVPPELRSLWDIPNGWRIGRRAEVWTRFDAGPGTQAVTVGLPAVLTEDTDGTAGADGQEADAEAAPSAGEGDPQVMAAE